MQGPNRTAWRLGQLTSLVLGGVVVWMWMIAPPAPLPNSVPGKGQAQPVAAVRPVPKPAAVAPGARNAEAANLAAVLDYNVERMEDTTPPNPLDLTANAGVSAAR